MSKYEHCFKCDCETGRAGAGDDSIYDSEGSGPYCEECYAKNELNERLAKLMGDQVTMEHGRPQLVTMFRVHLANYDDWKPDSDLNQACMVAQKLDFDVTIGRNSLYVDGGEARICAPKDHNGTPSDIARAICACIIEITGGGDE